MHIYMPNIQMYIRIKLHLLPSVLLPQTVNTSIRPLDKITIGGHGYSSSQGLWYSLRFINPGSLNVTVE